MTDILWNIVIQPLVNLIELTFSVFYRMTLSQGLAVVGVSLVVNLLCLPLYRMADARQEEERERQERMRHWVEHIKKHFSGDEQYMMLTTYYRQEGYKQWYALSSSVSLLLQIPFFIAAYSFLSKLSLLQGASFLFLENLGLPDGLLDLGGTQINVLPLVMTLLNCASTAAYTRGLPMKDKAQAYILALLFLVLLYDSPSGLVFYWTCNQLFSLIKNIVMKLWHPKELAHKNKALGGALCPEISNGTSTVQFLLAGLFLTLFLGLLIPSTVVADSPSEFVDISEMVNPLSSLIYTVSVWGGVTLFWMGAYFFLAEQKTRRYFGLFAWCLSGICLMNYFVLGNHLGTISNLLVYDVPPTYDVSEQEASVLVMLVVASVLFVIWKWKNQLVVPALSLLCMAVLILSVPNTVAIRAAVEEAREAEAAQQNALVDQDGGLRQLFHLSKTDKNVVIVFLDRAVSGYVPYIFGERPELANQFDGFVYYPNTLSFGRFTNFGSPALYGGYEYTPTEINKRSGESLLSKHDEALLVLPTLFSEAGYKTTVVDPPYAGSYDWVPYLALYDELQNTEAVSVAGGYTPFLKQQYGIGSSVNMDRTFFCYSIFKVLPECIQGSFYDEGNYLSTSTDTPPRGTLLDAYATLEYLPELTDAESEDPGFVLLANRVTHEPDYLQLPDYTPAAVVHNEGLENYERFEIAGKRVLMDTDVRLQHYHVNAAALLKLGAWFDWLREQGVYDNTRIIVVADHGSYLQQFEGWDIDKTMDVEVVNPLFMVKDFDAHGFTTSNEFMTNADTPTLSLKGLVKNPVNPATGVSISNSEKYAHDQVVTGSVQWSTTTNNGNTFDTSDAPWYSVHDDIFDLDNWKCLGYKYP